MGEGEFKNILRHILPLALSIVLIGTLHLFLPNEAIAATYYVNAVIGNDNNPGTEGSPWLTIQRSAGDYQQPPRQPQPGPGDTVYIKAGTYVEQVMPLNSGSEGNYITYQAYRGHEGRVIIENPNQGVQGLYDWEYDCIHLRGDTNLRYFIFKNLTLRTVPERGRGFHAGVDPRNPGLKSNIILDSLRIETDPNTNPRNYGYIGVSFENVTNGEIKNCRIYYNQFGINLGGGNRIILINNNHISHTQVVNPGKSWRSHGIQLWSDNTGINNENTNIAIVNNNVHNAKHTGISIWGAKEILVKNNKCHDNGTTGIQIQSDERKSCKNIVVDDNTCEDNGQDEEYRKEETGIWIDDTEFAVVQNNTTRYNPTGLRITASDRVIARNNLIYKNNINDRQYAGSSAGISVSIGKPPGIGQIPDRLICKDNTIVHNTLYNNGYPIEGDYVAAELNIGRVDNRENIPPDKETKNTVVKNNIISESAATRELRVNWKSTNTHSLDYNNYYNTKGTATYGDLKINWGTHSTIPDRARDRTWDVYRAVSGQDSHSFTSDPLFVDPNAANPEQGFLLQSGSHCIDKGGFLTETVSSGSGTQIRVADARYFTDGFFTDGFRLIEGDLIQLEGSNNPMRITAVNYDTNIITVNQSISWNAGVGVSYAYSGSAPDIGAYEYVTTQENTNQDGLHDAWEMLYFGNLDQGANDDPDGDGFTNLEEYLNGTDPTVYDGNQAPLANDQNLTTDEDTPIDITLTATDPEEEPLTYSIVTGPSQGRLTGVVPNVTYTPNTNYDEEDSFTFKANDGTNDSNVATISLNINPVNDRPELPIYNWSVLADQTMSFTLPQTDIDGDIVTYGIVSSTPPLPTGPSGPTFQNRTFSWTPTQADAASYRVKFKADDQQGLPNSVAYKIIIITVNAQPTTYYLDKSAPDGGDGSENYPWNSLAQALNLETGAQAGDTVYMRSGNYGDFSERNICRTDWVSFQARQAAGVGNPEFTSILVTSYPNIADSYLKFIGITVTRDDYIRAHVKLQNCQHLEFDNVRIEGHGYEFGDLSTGFILWGAHHVSIKNSVITGTGAEFQGGVEYGIESLDSEHITISNCTIDQCFIGIEADGNDWLIEGCHIFNIDNDAIQLNDASDVTINRNRIHDVRPVLIYSDDAGASYDAATRVITRNDGAQPYPSAAIGNEAFARLTDENGNYITPRYGEWLFVERADRDTLTLLEVPVPNQDYPNITKVEIKRGDHTDFIQFKNNGPCNNVTITNNICCNSFRNGFFLGSQPSQTLTIENNLLYNAHLQQGGVGNVICIGPIRDIVLRNNTLDGGVTAGLNVSFTSITGNIIKDIALQRQSGGVVIDEMEYNIFGYWNTYHMGPLPGPESTNQVLGNADDYELYKALFSNYNARDFTLNPNADPTAVDFINRADVPDTPDADVLGNPRDAQPDAGCYEYIPQRDLPPIAYDQIVETEEDTSIDITLTAKDLGGSSFLRYSIIDLPRYGTLTGNAPYVTYTPYPDDNGSDSFTFKVNNSRLDSNIATVTINITPVNDQPLLGTIGDKFVNEGRELISAIFATDPDIEDILRFSISNKPSFVTLADNGNGTANLIIAPGFNHAGTYDSIRITVTDNGTPVLSDYEDITITVNDVPAVPTYYVSPAGAGDHDGTSLEDAFSLSEAMSFASRAENLDKEIIFLLATGDYGLFIDNGIVRSNWITYRPIEGERPVFKGIFISYLSGAYLRFDGITVNSDRNNPENIIINTADYVELLNTAINGPGYAAGDNTKTIAMRSSNNVKINKCTITGTGVEYRGGRMYAIRGESSNHIEIRDCLIDQHGRAVVIINGNDWKVVDNHIYNMDIDGIVVTNSSNVDILDNETHDITVPPGVYEYCHGLKLEGNVSNIQIKRNKIYDITHHCMLLYPNSGPNVVVENNLCFGASNSGGNYHSVKIGSRFTGLVFRNNLVAQYNAGTKDGAIDISRYVNGTVIGSFKGNMVYQLETSPYRILNTIPNEDYTVYAEKLYITNMGPHSTDVGNINDFNNLFTNVRSKDFTHASAFARGVGHADPADYPSDDIDHNARNDGDPDAGCYEYSP